jgi:DNA-3-methyladenine glycosylase II
VEIRTDAVGAYNGMIAVTASSPAEREHTAERGHSVQPERAAQREHTAQREGAINRLRHADPVLGRLIDSRPDFDPRAWLSNLPALDAFGALVFQVVGQQLSVSATRRILGRLQDQFGGRMPTPSMLLATGADDLRRTGLSRRKAATLRAIAERFADGTLRDDALRRLSDSEVGALLTKIPGIGPWTVHGFLIIALDRPDVVLPGDLALLSAIRRVYQLDHLPSQQEVVQIAERWRPQRSLATAYLFQAAFEADAKR